MSKINGAFLFFKGKSFVRVECKKGSPVFNDQVKRASPRSFKSSPENPSVNEELHEKMLIKDIERDFNSNNSPGKRLMCDIYKDPKPKLCNIIGFCRLIAHECKLTLTREYYRRIIPAYHWLDQNFFFVINFVLSSKLIIVMENGASVHVFRSLGRFQAITQVLTQKVALFETQEEMLFNEFIEENSEPSEITDF